MTTRLGSSARQAHVGPSEERVCKIHIESLHGSGSRYVYKWAKPTLPTALSLPALVRRYTTLIALFVTEIG